MAVRYTRMILLAAAAVGLSGCSSIFHSALFRGERSTSMATAAVMTPYTDAGRAYLVKGETGHAIEAFQRALGLGEPAAPALNGLGVCFARLGRPETAQRLFEQAMILAPDNAQYADNLARLERSQAMAMRDGLIVAPAQRTEAARLQAPIASQMVQISANEYHLRTVAPAAPPLMGQKRMPQNRLALVGKRKIPAPSAKLEAAHGRAHATAGSARRTLIANPYVRQESSSRVEQLASGAAL